MLVGQSSRTATSSCQDGSILHHIHCDDLPVLEGTTETVGCVADFSAGSWRRCNPCFQRTLPCHLQTPMGRAVRVLIYNDCDTSMISDRIGYELALLAVLSVLTIFLFPGVQGPYSVIHGPATVFQAARAAARLRIAIVQGVLSSMANRLMSPLATLSWMSPLNPELQSVGLPEYNTILRC